MDYQSIGNQITERIGGCFSKKQSIESDPVKEYIHKRWMQFNVLQQLSQNILVRELNDGFHELDNQKTTDLKAYCVQHLEPTIEAAFVDIGLGVCVRDTLHLLEHGTPLIDAENPIDYLVEVERLGLVAVVRAEVKAPKPAWQIQQEKQEARKAAALKADLERLEGQLQAAKQDLSKAPKVQKEHYQAKVAEIEKQIEEVKAGNPLTSIRWN